jgi:tetratricopeptide (TPR) repeat protein
VAENQDRNEDPILDPTQQEDADVVFQLEMQARNLLLGYWKHGVAAILGVLGIILIFGVIDHFITKGLQETSYDVARIDKKLSEDDPGYVDLSAPTTPTQTAILKKAAELYAAAGEGGGGAPGADAWIKSASMHQRLGDLAAAQTAYERALDNEDSGVIGYASSNGLASIHMAEGRTDQAITLYRAIADVQEGYLAERALMDLASAYDAQGDSGQLAAVVAEFDRRFPASPRRVRLPVVNETTALNGG